MTSLSAKQLENIANELAGRFSSMSEEEIREGLKWIDYHGFEKARVVESLLQQILEPMLVTTFEVQVEVVKVTTDLSDQVHYHYRSTAFVLALGEQHHFERALHAAVCIDGAWLPFFTGDRVIIPAGTSHGFRVVGSEGVLYFLSVQSPPIVDEYGHDDYHLEPEGGM